MDSSIIDNLYTLTDFWTVPCFQHINMFFRRPCSHINQPVKLMLFLWGWLDPSCSQELGRKVGCVWILKGEGTCCHCPGLWEENGWLGFLEVNDMETHELCGKIGFWEINPTWGGNLRRNPACVAENALWGMKSRWKVSGLRNKKSIHFLDDLNFWNRVINYRLLPNTTSEPPYLLESCCAIIVNIDHLYVLFLTFTICSSYVLFSYHLS